MSSHMRSHAPLPAVLSSFLWLFLIGTVSSQAPRQVADINTTKIPQSSYPSPNRYHNNRYQDDSHYAQIGPRAYFSATSSTTGYELYTSLGTPSGGDLLKDINPGTGGSYPNNFTKVGNKIYFTANDAKTGNELWVTDGKSAGTKMVADLYSGSLGSSPRYLCPLGNTGKLVFQASTATARAELFISDGTAKGTKLLKDIYPGVGYSSPSYMKTFHNGKKDIVVFYARTASNGYELWSTDGTATGTTLLKDIWAGLNSSSPRYFQVLGKKVIFQASTSTRGLELWVTDGTSTGTKLLKTINQLSRYGSGLYYGVPLFGKYYFEGHDSQSGYECWVTDGTTAGTKRVVDSNPGSASGYFKYGIPLGTKILYNGYVVSKGYELMVLDSITGKSSLLKDLYAGSGSSNPSQFETVRNKVVFSARSATTGTELFISDGTPAGTKLLKDIYPGSASSYCVSLTRLITNRVIFRAAARDKNNYYSTDLWVTDGTPQGTIKVPVAWKNAPTANSYPAYATELRGKLYFAANDGVKGTELWSTDAKGARTGLLKDIFPGVTSSGSPYSSYPSYLARAGDRLVFSADDGQGKGRELWTSDGTAAGTRLLKDIFDGLGSSAPQSMGRVGNKVYFQAHGYDNSKPRNYVGKELYVTDGTAAGTRFVADLNPGFLSSYARGFTGIGNSGKFVFAASGVAAKAPFTSVGYELFISDGTTAGTRLLKDIYPGSNSSSPSSFESMGGKVYFSARTRTAGVELWVTDGTPTGTVMVKDIYLGYGSGYPTYLQVQGGKLWFYAYTRSGISNQGYELWESDGTAKGTKLFKDLATGYYSGSPRYITAAGSRHLWFAAYSRTSTTWHGYELWRSDLTLTGTKLHADIWPGSLSSSPQGFSKNSRSRFAVLDGQIFFIARSAAYGQELWVVDNGATATPFGDACSSSHMTSTDPVLGKTAKISGSTQSGFSANVVLLGVRSPTALPMGGECRLHLNLLGPMLLVGTSTGTTYSAALPIPNLKRLVGVQVALQTLHLGSSFPGGSGFSNGLSWALGY